MMDDDRNRRRNFRDNRRDFRKPRRPYGKDTEDIDLTKIKMVNEDAIKRSEYHNNIVDRLEFSTPSGKYCTVSGHQLLLYTLMPSKPLIDCQYIRLEVAYEDAEKKKGCIIRLCGFNKTPKDPLEICQVTIEKIAKGMCVGRKTHVASHEFWVVTGGHMQIDEVGKEFKIIFVNKNANALIKEELRLASDPLKAKSLFNLYNAIKTGSVKLPSIPKPGNILFHTLFSGIVNVDIETITGETFKGVVKGYELTPGGSPSLNTWITEEKLRVVPLYTIATMLVEKYQINDMMRRRTLELTLKGHIVIPHPATNSIFDSCKRYMKPKDQEIKLDGTITPFDNLDKHDTELSNVIRTIN